MRQARARLFRWGAPSEPVDQEVVRYGHELCSCFQAMQMYDDLPEPPAAPMPDIQPVGCSNPTFTGAGFDLTHVALQGVRVAVSTMCTEAGHGYPAIDWDVAVISLRSKEGQLIAPITQTFALPRHPRCPVCERRAA